MESHTYHDLRKDRYIRPADPDKPEYEPWRETPEMNSWKYSSAVPPKHKKKSPAASEKHREKNRIYRAKRRAELKAQDAAKPKAKRKPIRTCNTCGKPALESVTMNLCREHFNEYQRENRRRAADEIGAIKEAQDAAKKSLLERLWSKKMAEYENKDESQEG